MLQDLVVAAVNDALRASRELAEREDGRRDRRPADSRGCRPPPRGHAPHRARRPAHRVVRAPARASGPKTAQRLTYHLLRAPDAEARALAAALVDVRDKVVFCERCFNISDAPLCPICRDPAPRPDPAVRRRGAARRPGPRADRRVQGPLPRPPRRDLADRRHRPGPAARSASCSPAPTRRSATATPFEEVILATNPTLEGEATAMYLAERLEAVGRRRQPDRPRPARSAATSSTPTR